MCLLFALLLAAAAAVVENSSSVKDMFKHMSLSLNLICFIANTHDMRHCLIGTEMEICKSHIERDSRSLHILSAGPSVVLSLLLLAIPVS